MEHVQGLILLAVTNVTDPSGNSWEPGSAMWFYWSGFGVGCTLIVFALVKRLALRAVSQTTEF